MLISSFLEAVSAFTNRIWSWSFANNFGFLWQLTCQVLVLENKDLWKLFELIKQNHLSPEAVSTRPANSSHWSVLLSHFPLVSRSPCSHPRVRSLPKDSPSQLHIQLHSDESFLNLYRQTRPYDPVSPGQMACKCNVAFIYLSFFFLISSDVYCRLQLMQNIKIFWYSLVFFSTSRVFAIT